jgi:hypothetical protein
VEVYIMREESDTQHGISENGADAGGGRPKSLRLTLFLYNIGIIAVLAGLAYLFETKGFAASEYSIYLASAWFGALGGVIISLKGIYDHAAEKWDDSFDLWHFGRPISGGVAGFMTVILLTAVVPASKDGTAPSKDSTAPNHLAIYAAAFILGTQERRFFNLLSEVARLVVQVPDEAKPQGLMLTEIVPAEGPAGTVVAIKGQGIEAGATMKLGGQALEKPVVASDGTFAAGAVPDPKGEAGATVDVIVINRNGISFVLPQKFKYTS